MPSCLKRLDRLEAGRKILSLRDAADGTSVRLAACAPGNSSLSAIRDGASSITFVYETPTNGRYVYRDSFDWDGDSTYRLITDAIEFVKSVSRCSGIYSRDDGPAICRV